jgi:hypothetical protein
MVRVFWSRACPNCAGPRTREPSLLGAVYVCERCDRGEARDSTDPWVDGELKPLADGERTDRR